MNGTAGAGNNGAPRRVAGHPAADAARLRQAAHQLEGIFVAELFKAMRATVPQDGILSQDPGQELFTGLLDDRVADVYAERPHGGLGEALYRQLIRRLPGTAPDGGTP